MFHLKVCPCYPPHTSEGRSYRTLPSCHWFLARFHFQLNFFPRPSLSTNLLLPLASINSLLGQTPSLPRLCLVSRLWQIWRQSCCMAPLALSLPPSILQPL